jgi:hypothetical protein
MKAFTRACIMILCVTTARAVTPKEELAAAIEALGKQSYRWETEGYHPFVSEDSLEGKIDSEGLTQWQMVVSNQRLWIVATWHGRAAMLIGGVWRNAQDALRIARSNITVTNEAQHIETRDSLIWIKAPGTILISDFGYGIQVFQRVQHTALPATELGWYLTNAEKIESNNRYVTLTLYDDAARNLGGIGVSSPGFKIEKVIGTVKIWLKKGAVSKYELDVRWLLNGEDRNRTLTTVVKDVGSTKVKIPPEALKLIQ